eukprot:INCI13462.5.p1 GENE.INCI13462.5~~INCI13462.5.p1  ORF type:complete len:501 (+),score=102.49 INCI13462.5:87-1505(+)
MGNNPTAAGDARGSLGAAAREFMRAKEASGRAPDAAAAYRRVRSKRATHSSGRNSDSGEDKLLKEFRLSDVPRAPALSKRRFVCPERATSQKYFNNARNILQEAMRGTAEPQALAHAERYLCCSLRSNRTNALAWAYRGLAIPGVLPGAGVSTRLESRELAVQFIAWALKLTPDDPEIMDLMIQQLQMLEAERKRQRPTLFSYAALLTNMTRSFYQFDSPNPEYWYKRGYLFETNQVKRGAIDSFLRAWRMRPDDDKFSSKMLVLQGRRMSNTEFLKLRANYSEMDSLVNYRTWVNQQDEALRREGVGNSSTHDLVETHIDGWFVPRGKSHLPPPLSTDISESERAAAVRMFGKELDVVRRMRNGLEKLATADVCAQIHNSLGAAETRIGVMYLLQKMDVHSELTMQNLGVTEAPFSGAWQIVERSRARPSASSGTNEQEPENENFPAILVNLLVSVRAVQTLRPMAIEFAT